MQAKWFIHFFSREPFNAKVQRDIAAFKSLVRITCLMISRCHSNVKRNKYLIARTLILTQSLQCWTVCLFNPPNYRTIIIGRYNLLDTRYYSAECALRWKVFTTWKLLIINKRDSRALPSSLEFFSFDIMLTESNVVVSCRHWYISLHYGKFDLLHSHFTGFWSHWDVKLRQMSTGFAPFFFRPSIQSQNNTRFSCSWLVTRFVYWLIIDVFIA